MIFLHPLHPGPAFARPAACDETRPFLLPTCGEKVASERDKREDAG
jgi:hypothetical protein